MSSDQKETATKCAFVTPIDEQLDTMEREEVIRTRWSFRFTGNA